MGKDAMYRVVVGIVFEEVEEELQGIYNSFKNVNQDEFNLENFLSENGILFGFCEWESNYIIGVSIHYQDWEQGFVEVQPINTLIDGGNYNLLMEAIDNLHLEDDDEKDIDLTEFKEVLKIMMDCAKAYSYCDYY